jgi:hypothetical protein
MFLLLDESERDHRLLSSSHIQLDLQNGSEHDYCRQVVCQLISAKWNKVFQFLSSIILKLELLIIYRMTHLH